MTTQKNKPVRTLRDGAIKATIWRNVREDGEAYYSCELSRTYQDDSGYHDSHSFSGAELLKASHLAAKAYDAMHKLRGSDAS